jgi:hypothetical protein
MFREQKSGSRAHAQRRSASKQGSREDIQARIAGLRSVPRENLADAVFMLSMEAKQQSGLLRQAIKRRAQAEFEFDASPDGDLATWLAEDAVSTLRHHAASHPGLLDLLVQRSPDVRFTVNRDEAVSLLAAMVREQRLEGILEGLRLAGLLNEPSKGRHAGFGELDTPSTSAPAGNAGEADAGPVARRPAKG